MLINLSFIFAIYYFLTLTYSKADMENCRNIKCSNVIDPVCGAFENKHGRRLKIKTFTNLCHFKKMQCQLRPIYEYVELNLIPSKICKIKTKVVLLNVNGRRIQDHAIVGSYEACNHTCPTFCIDTYEPACAQIWKPGMKSNTLRPMVNHCHIDLFSCVSGQNVTIHPISRCFKNSAGLLFMSEMAALKSLKLIDE